MTQNQLCEALRTRWYLTVEEIDAILADRDFFHPYLRNALAKRAELGRIPEDPIDATDSNAIFLLTEISDTGIIPDLIQCLGRNVEVLELLYSDSITEHMWLPFAKLGQNYLDEIWEFAIDASIDLFARHAVVAGVIAVHHFHPDRRQETVAFIERLLSRTDSFPVDHLASILCDCAYSGLMELKDKAQEFAAIINGDDEDLDVMATADDVLRAFRKGARKDFISGRAHDVYGVNKDWQRWSEAVQQQKKQPVIPGWLKEHAELIEQVKKIASSHLEIAHSQDAVASLKDQYHLSVRLSRVITTAEEMEQLEKYTDADVTSWLLALPFELAQAGLMTEATEMGRVWANVTERANFLGDRVVILAEAALSKETHEQIEEALSLFPGDVWVRIKVGDAHRTLGELEEAEKCYRHALTISGDDYDRKGVLERLIPLLDELGRKDEAKTLEAEEEFREKKRKLFRSGKIVETTIGPLQQAQKIGRNDPCPCGSGKKYKKCHGR